MENICPHLAELHWKCATAGFPYEVAEEVVMDVDLPRLTFSADVPHKDNWLLIVSQLLCAFLLHHNSLWSSEMAFSM